VEEPHRELAQMNVLVVPSRSEGMGIVILEALNMKVPVIASAVGGIKEVIKDNVTGMLFEPENASELALKINELLNDKMKSLILKENGFRYQRAVFNNDLFIQRHIEVYKSIVEKNGSM